MRGSNPVAKKKKRTDEEDGSDVGMIMTVSLFLILLTFFILLNSISVIDEKKTRLALGSLMGAFGSFHGGLSPLGSGDSVNPPSAPMIEQNLEMNELITLMKKNEEVMGTVKLGTWRKGFVITINEEKLFEGDTTDLKPSSHPLLKQLAGFLKMGDYPLDIIGHTDSRPGEEKGYGSNWKHSALMAIKVLEYFKRDCGIASKRLSARGAAGFRPIALNDTQDTRALNRRVEVIVNPKVPGYVKRIFWKKHSGIFTYKKFNFRVYE